MRLSPEKREGVLALYCWLIIAVSSTAICGDSSVLKGQPSGLRNDVLRAVDAPISTNQLPHPTATGKMVEQYISTPVSSMLGFFQRLSITMQIAVLFSTSPSTSSPTSYIPNTKSPAIINYTTAEAGNPFVDGWYADPDTAIYNDLYWVFPTSSYKYEQQTYLDAFSSPDLTTWTKHANILTIADVKWATRAVWAPAPAFRNGKYYIYFGANDIQEGEPEEGLIGGIGVAVADEPQGPYVDALGKPLIGEYHNGAQPIDQDVFIDDDGQAYIYYGGHGHANVAKLNEDMISISPFDDNTTFIEITPENYVEGSQMLKRNGKYYFMWSEGGWGLPNYSVSYAMADSPLGPFPREAKILQQDSAVAKSSGHHGVIHIPGTDIYYIVYHRRPLSETDRDHRVLAYDRMYFNEDGTIAPVRMLVKDNFADGNMIGWKTYGEEWKVVDQRLSVGVTQGSLAVLDTNFTGLVFDSTVQFLDKYNSGSAGLVFRVHEAADGTDGFSGYYAGLLTSGAIILEKIETGIHTTLAITPMAVHPGIDYRIRVVATESNITVYVDSFDDPKLEAADTVFADGTDGVAVFGTAANFGNVSILKPDEI